MAAAAKHSSAAVKDAASSPRHPLTSPRQSQVMQQQPPFLESPQRSAPPGVSTSAASNAPSASVAATTSAAAFQLPAHLRQLGQPVSPGETPIRRSTTGHHHHHHQQLHLSTMLPAASSGIAGLAAAAGAATGTEVEIRDWSLDDSRQRELEEARNRAAQMEKTMRWWSDCTASWRDKWAKTRNERNKSREEAQQLRQALEQARRELEAVRRDRDGLLAQVSSTHGLSTPTTAAAAAPTAAAATIGTAAASMSAASQPQSMSLPALAAASNPSGQIVRCGQLSPRQASAAEDNNGKPLTNNGHGQLLAAENSYQIDSGSLLPLEQCSIGELTKRLQFEQAERSRLERAVAALHSELAAAARKGRSNQRAAATANSEDFDEEDFCEDDNGNNGGGARNSYYSAVASSEEARIEELQREIERLLAVNASEWSHRERLQAQLGATEREARRLRQELADLRVPATSASAVAAAATADADEAAECEAAFEALLEDDELNFLEPNHASQPMEQQQQQQLLRRLKQKFPENVGVLDVQQRQHQGANSRRLQNFVAFGSQQMSGSIAAQSQELQCQLWESRSRIKRMERQVRCLTSELAHSERRCRQYSAEAGDLRCRVDQVKDQLAAAEDELDSANRLVRRLRLANAELANRASQLAGDCSSSPDDALELACCVTVGGEFDQFGADIIAPAGERRSLPTMPSVSADTAAATPSTAAAAVPGVGCLLISQSGATDLRKEP